MGASPWGFALDVNVLSCKGLRRISTWALSRSTSAIRPLMTTRSHYVVEGGCDGCLQEGRSVGRGLLHRGQKGIRRRGRTEERSGSIVITKQPLIRHTQGIGLTTSARPDGYGVRPPTVKSGRKLSNAGDRHESWRSATATPALNTRSATHS